MIKLFIGLIAVLLSACNSTPGNKTKVEEKAVEAPTAEVKETINPQAFFQAALDGNLEIVENAINTGIDVNQLDENQRTALMLAAFNGHQHILKVLIDKGAKVNMADATDRTALMFASTGPFVPAVKLLLESGAKPNMIDNHEKWTALMMAAAEGQLEVIKVLLANGADVKMVDIDGESAEYFARQKGHTAVADYLKNLK